MNRAGEEYRAGMTRLYAVAASIVDLPLDQWLQAIERAETLGPALNPTLWREKSTVMFQDKAAIEAALPLWRLAQNLRVRALKSEELEEVLRHQANEGGCRECREQRHPEGT